MAKTKIGKVGITPKGAYSNEKNYVRLDVVTENGSSYVCLKDCVGKAVTDTEYWQLVAEKGDKGDKPETGIDYNTDAEKTEFKNEVVTETKTDIADYVTEQKTELNKYTETKKGELDEYESTKETELNTKATELTSTFNSNATSKTKSFNENVTAKLKEYNDNSDTKLADFNSNSTMKLEEYNTNATNKVTEFNNNVDSLENELTELAQQMPWNTTNISESIHIEDSAKYSRNKLDLFGNLKQETREGYNRFNVETITANKFLTKVGVIGDSKVSNISDFIPVTANKAYTISFDYTTLKDSWERTICFYNTEKTVLSGTQYIPSSKKITINSTEDGYLRFSYDVNCKNIQCVEGSEEKTYESYGVMPSIDYPSMPQTATGVQKITKIGKNFWSAKFNFVENGLKVTTDENGLITVNGTPTANITKHYIVNKKIENGNYVLSVDKDLSNYKISISVREKIRLCIIL